MVVEKDGKRLVRKQGIIKSIIKLAKEIIINEVKHENTDKTTIDVLTSILGLFSNYLNYSTIKD